MTTENPLPRLEALAGMTAETEAANPSQEQQAQAEKAQTEASQAEQGAKDWGLLMYSIGGLVCMIEPKLKPVYSEDRCLTWGEHANTVAAKYGWNGVGLMPEITLIGCTIGFAVPTVLVLRQTLAKVETGTGPDTWITKIGIWWRMRQAKTGKPAGTEKAAA